HARSQCDQAVRVPAEERQLNKLQTADYIAQRGAFPLELNHGRGNRDSLGRRAWLETDIDRCRKPDAEVHVGYVCGAEALLVYGYGVLTRMQIGNTIVTFVVGKRL